MKALDMLKQLRQKEQLANSSLYAYGEGNYPPQPTSFNVKQYDEAMGELEALQSRNCGNCNHNKAEDEFMIFCNKVVCADGSRMMWHSYTREYCCKYWETKNDL